MASVNLDPRAETLLEPVHDIVQRGLSQLPAGSPIEVSVGDVEGFYTATASRVVLSSRLEGPELHHPDEWAGPVPPLDRWRRAVASVLEGAAMAALASRTKTEPTAAWWWCAMGIHAADLAAPELSIAAPDLACAVATANPGAHPRAGLAIARAWLAEGVEPIPRVRYLVEGGVISTREWLRLGAWVLGPRGPRTMLPVPVSRPAPIDVPATLPPWSWARLSVPAHPRGGHVRVEGAGEVDAPWAVGGESLHTLAGATAQGCTLVPESGGPVGRWEVASAEGFGQVMGARGVTYVFRADGSLELVMADAFVGPLAALAMAGEVGTSGVARARWRVVGPRRLRFGDLDTSGLTMHGRRERFMVPAQGFGMGEWLKALADDVWQWERARDGRLRLTGRMLGGEVEVRLRPAPP